MKNRPTQNPPPAPIAGVPAHRGLGLGVLEQLDAKVEAVQSALEALAEQVRAHAPVAWDAGDVWAGGACDLATAEAEYGVSRSELYKRMGAGELPYAVVTRERLVPRRALAAILKKHQRNGEALATK